MRRSLGELAKYVVVGIVSNLVALLVYVVAYNAGAPLAVASVLSYVSGTLNSFYFARNWVFETGTHAGKMALLRFSIVYAVGGAGMTLIIEMLDRTQLMDYRISWLFGTLFAFTNNFLGAKLLVFAARSPGNGR